MKPEVELDVAPAGPGTEAPSQLPAMGLVWPARDKGVRWNGRHWAIDEESDSPTAQVLPLLPVADARRPHLDPWYMRGDHLKSLESLRAAVGRNARLVYFETPRLETDLTSFAAEDSRGRLNAWLTLNQATFRRALSLTRDDGVIAVMCGVAEQPYLQVLLDEMLGPENRVGTVAWQKGYSVQGQKKGTPKQEIYPTHDCVLIYSRRKTECLPSAALKAPPKNFANPDGDPRGPWKAEQKGANYARESSDFSVNVPPYRWEIVSDQLPPWLWRISPRSGVIWVPGDQIREAGTWTIRVKVTDAAGASAVQDFSITVADGGDGPSPAVPTWLIARDANGQFARDGAPANAPRAGGKLTIQTKSLPVGAVGRDYFACIGAEGGSPSLGTTRPGKNSTSGKSRYWDVAAQTFEKAAAEDAVDFKTGDDSIPAIKVFLRGADFTYLNQISTWRGDGKGKVKGGKSDPMRVGWQQDAKKELEELHAQGVIQEVIGISKPAGLMSRLLAMFTEENDLVVDVGSPAAEMASVGCQLGRKVIYVDVPGTETSAAQADTIRLPRMRAAARGNHPLPDGVIFSASAGDVPSDGYFVGRRPRERNDHADVVEYQLGKPFAETDPVTAVATIDYGTYPAGSAEFHQALASLEGLVWHPGDGGEFARSQDGRMIAVHLSGKTVLDGRALEDVQSRYSEWLGASGTSVRVYFHRGHDDIAPVGGRIELRQIPYGLILAAGGWSR